MNVYSVDQGSFLDRMIVAKDENEAKKYALITYNKPIISIYLHVEGVEIARFLSNKSVSNQDRINSVEQIV